MTTPYYTDLSCRAWFVLPEWEGQQDVAFPCVKPRGHAGSHACRIEWSTDDQPVSDVTV